MNKKIPENKFSPPYQRIVLIGYRCVGKTSIGKKLAVLTGWEYWSTDDLIEKKCSMSISEFVKQQGWEKFREVEHSVIAGLGEENSCIIDCGGGVVESGKNMNYLQKNSMVVWIDADLKIILERLEKSSDRPPLESDDIKTDVEQTYFRRVPLYKNYHQVYLNSTAGTVDTLATELFERLIN